MEKSLSQFGTISGSTTFPGQCSLHETDTSSVHTETRLLLTTCDVNGKFRTNGGDPVKAEVVKKRDKEDMVSSESHAIGATIIDNDDGTYIITFKYLFCLKLLCIPFFLVIRLKYRKSVVIKNI